MATRTVADIMTTDVITVDPSMTVTEAAKLMIDNKIGALPVVEGGGLIGIVTEGDLIMQDVKLEYPTYLHFLDGYIMYPPSTKHFESELKKAVAADVRTVMTADPTTVQVGATIEDAATLLAEKDVSRLPVLDGDDLVGVVSKSDVVRSLLVEE
jgi:CBS domain-containing protein